MFAAMCFAPLPDFYYSETAMTYIDKHLHLTYSSAKSGILPP